MEWVPLVGLIYSILKDTITAGYTLYKDRGRPKRTKQKRRLSHRRRRS